jgi:hypothetical protein
MSGIREWARANWVILLGASLLFRLLIAPFAYGFQYDMDTFGNWGYNLSALPLDQFYARADGPDHLPGDLYIHAVLAEGFQFFGGENFLGDSYRYLLKVVPSVMDILLAVLIWAFARRLVGEGFAREGALLYALNPATIFLSAIWGQWDVVSSLIMLAGLVIVWARPAKWLFAIPVLAWAVLIKPPLALLCLIGLLTLVLVDLRRGLGLPEIVRFRIASVLAAAVIGVATIVVLILPFDTGLPGMDTRWSLLDRVEVAVDLYPNTTLGAANIWMIPLGSPDRISDVDDQFFGLTPQGWGTVFFAVALLYVAATIMMRWRMIRPIDLVVWAMATANYAYFLLPTRSHERYLYPAVLLLILLATLCRMEGRLVRLAAAVSLVYFLNLVAVYDAFPGVLNTVMFVTLSILNVVLFALVATFPYWWKRDKGLDEVEGVGTPMPVYADDVTIEVAPV